ncbi:MAG: hypothetical protein MZW92_05870 [Comamonadaceae bacterium]|nr:hypothetical protein [Comamonadaceae bacterium]
MAKLTIDDLKKIKDRVEKEDQFRAGTKRIKLTVHMGTCGIASGAKEILDTFMSEISENNRERCPHHHLGLHRHLQQGASGHRRGAGQGSPSSMNI